MCRRLPQQPYDVEYRMLWQKDNDTRPSLAYVAQTRRGHGYLRKPDESISLIIDFEGQALRKLPADTPVQGVVSNRLETSKSSKRTRIATT